MRQSEHPLYRRWRGINDRCSDPAYFRYHAYGGRGIYVCDRWRNSKGRGSNKWAPGFLNFVEDMVGCPGPEFSLDRINNDGPYSPENCRWATSDIQHSNTRPRPGIGFYRPVKLSSTRELPRWVYKNKKKFVGRVRIRGENISSPSLETPELAYLYALSIRLEYRWPDSFSSSLPSKEMFRNTKSKDT